MSITITKQIGSAYIPSPGRLAQTDVRQELERLKKLDPSEQSADSRIPVEIGGTTAYFSRGLSKVSPPFVQHSPSPSSGITRVHLLLESTVAVYDNQRGQKSWERRALLPLDKPELILAGLPKKAFIAEVSTAPATIPQLGVIKKNLQLPLDESLSGLTAAAVSRMIDRLTCERDVHELLIDAQEWLGEPTRDFQAAA